jgi:hypothetical protein
MANANPILAGGQEENDGMAREWALSHVFSLPCRSSHNYYAALKDQGSLESSG